VTRRGGLRLNIVIYYLQIFNTCDNSHRIFVLERIERVCRDLVDWELSLPPPAPSPFLSLSLPPAPPPSLSFSRALSLSECTSREVVVFRTNSLSHTLFLNAPRQKKALFTVDRAPTFAIRNCVLPKAIIYTTINQA
jgi:hypothetical protein